VLEEAQHFWSANFSEFEIDAQNCQWRSQAKAEARTFETKTATLLDLVTSRRVRREQNGIYLLVNLKPE